MNIAIHRGPFALEPGPLEQRLRRALAARAELIEALRVTLSDENGPRGGADKRAALLLDLRGGGRVKSVATSPSLKRALELALEGLRRGLASRLGRRRSRRRAARRRSRESPSGVTDG
ncbi:MAG: hypothetical protein H6807_11730 [Planctomycetes bacterium]|nr:hypothetical protein [Planctomycetota bacterium]